MEFPDFCLRCISRIATFEVEGKEMARLDGIRTQLLAFQSLNLKAEVHFSKKKRKLNICISKHAYNTNGHLNSSVIKFFCDLWVD